MDFDSDFLRRHAVAFGEDSFVKRLREVVREEHSAVS
jgi:hypothetical protein